MQPPSIIVQIVHLYGPHKGQIQEFSESRITIGRNPDSLVLFPADLAIVSRKHAEIVREGNRFKLTDSSANGTLVNGKKVKGETYLKDGDVLTFSEGGPKVSFLTQMDKDTVHAVPSPPQTRVPTVEEPESESGIPPKPEIMDDLELSHEQDGPVPDAPSAPVNAPLTFQYGPTIRSFKQVPVTVGKHPSCEFMIEHPALYDRQVQIFFSQNKYWIKDLTGREMVLLNGRPFGVQASLAKDDTVALSQQGPFFRYLGEGRLVEMESPLPTPEEVSDREKGASDSQENKERKSLLGRFFRKES